MSILRMNSFRKALIVVAAIALVVTPFASQNIVSAKQPKNPLEASGTLCLVGLPRIHANMAGATKLRISAHGEQLGGVIADSNWTDITGAEISATINKEESVFNLATQTFDGKIAGKISIMGSSGVIGGSMEGVVSGAFLPFTNPEDLLTSIYTSTAEVKWNLKGKWSNSGDNEKTEAKGTASVTFVADPENGTYCGPLVLNGTFSD